MSSETKKNRKEGFISHQELGFLVEDNAKLIEAGIGEQTISTKNLLELLDEVVDARRAQQAEPPAGCAEMATTIENAIADADESGFDEWRCGIIHDKLAPLFTLLADCRDDFEAIRDTLGETPVRIRNTAWRARKRIDAALGKGDADGGREEPSE